METIDRYLELTENGRAVSDDLERPPVRRTLEALHDYAREHGGLELEGAWRLETRVARDLTETQGYTPAGGWRAVASLAAGTELMSAGRERFEAQRDRSALADWDGAAATQSLLEAFTRRLVPPTTAAGLFILLGIHPAWGVHVAHRAHRRFAAGTDPSGVGGEPSGRSELFPEEVFEVVESAVFDVIGVLVALFRKLEPASAYPVDALSNFIDGVCGRIRDRSGAGESPVPEGALPPFVSLDRRSSNWRVIDFTTADLIDAFLVPAGAAHRFNDGTFAVYSGAFQGVRAGAAGPEAQDRLLTSVLTDGSGDRVA